MELVSECFVKPMHKVEASKERIHLRSLDLCMLSIHPMQKGLLFALDQPNNQSSLLTTLLDNLKHCLSIALLHFYPLAGRFETETFPDEHACTVFINCNKGPGARLTHIVAENVTVSDIIFPVYVPPIVNKFFDLGEKYVNYDCHSRPLLSIQVTQLVDGVFIGFTMTHTGVDGTSIMHFLSMLSELFCSKNTCEKSLDISRVPIYEHVTPLKLPYLGLDEVMKFRDIGLIRDRIFHFSCKSMSRLKTKANQQASSTYNVSSFQSLASLIWRSITKARNVPGDQETCCSMLMDARSRLDPPLSNDYFGNYLAPFNVLCKVEELLSNDLGWAAMRFNDAVKAQNDKSIRGTWNGIGGHISSKGFRISSEDFHGPNGVVIGGSPRLDMYGVEFGLGKAVAARMGYGNKGDGKVTASQGREGGGSVDLEISLKEEHMIALEADHEFMSYVS